jgi:hypothetical protein
MLGPETVKLRCHYEVLTRPIADGAASSDLLCQPVITAAATGEVARTVELSLVINLGAPAVVDGLGMAAPAWLSSVKSAHNPNANTLQGRRGGLG